MPTLPHPQGYSPMGHNAVAEAAFNARSEHSCVHGLLEEVFAKVMIQYRDNQSDTACDIINGLQELKARARLAAQS